MDIAVYTKVLSRHRQLIGIGLLVAFVLAFASLARVGLDGLKPTVSYRQNEVWISASTLFVTQEGFPWGRSILDETQGDPGRYPGLAQLYAALATSDAVRRNVMSDAPPDARYEAEVVRSADSTVLPLIYMKGFGPSSEVAQTMANRAASVFRRYIENEQVRNRIPPDRRVRIALLSAASNAEIFAGRSMVRPVFVFLLILSVFVALAFVVDNMRTTGPQPEGWTTWLRDRLSATTWLPGRALTVERQPAPTTVRSSAGTAKGPAPLDASARRPATRLRRDERRARKSAPEGAADEPPASGRRSA